LTAARAWAAPALALLLLACAPRVLAHASLVSSVPADGASLDAAPAELVLRFDEPVHPVQLRLVDATGRAVEPRVARVEHGALHLAAPAGMATGAHVLSYRVTSSDSHPVAGAITFSIGAPAPAPAARGAAARADSGPDAVSIALRAARDIALLAATGAALFVLAVRPFPGQRRTLAVAGLAAALLSALCLGWHGAVLLGAGTLMDARAWTAAIDTSFGTSTLVAIGASAAIAAAALAPARVPATAALVLGAAAGVASLALTGHAAAAGSRAWAGAALAAHALAAAFWLGSLVALHAVLRRDASRSAEALWRFSRLATGMVALLAAAGVALAAFQLRALESLAATPYGRLVLFKAALFAALLALAAINRFVLMPRLAHGAPQATRALTRVVGLEVALVLAVLGVTAVLVQTSPRGEPGLDAPGAATAFAAAPVSKTLAAAGGRTATLTLAPARPGRNTLAVELRGADGRALDPAAVDVSISHPAAGIEPLQRAMRRTAAGRWVHEGTEWALGGTWRVEIRARLDDFEDARWSTEVDVH